MLRNLPNVTKNILLLNVTIYIVALVLASNGTDLGSLFGAHYINSILFEPYQIVTHMFMHDLNSPLHIFFNMFLLVMFGSHLERIWGSKRFFIFYIASGLGAFVLYNSIGVWQIYSMKQQLLAENMIDIDTFHNMIRDHWERRIGIVYPSSQLMTDYEYYNVSTMVGASGAIFGLLAGFAMLFPNTELMLLFPPIPIKAKYLIGGYIVFEIINSFSQQDSHIAHLAHVGGAIVGIIFILVWRKRDRQNFW
jgi:membrane associated rhomboid family serine protease